MPTGARPAARASLGAVSVEPEPDEGTRLHTRAPAQPAAAPVRQRTELPPLQPRAPMPALATAAPLAAPAAGAPPAMAPQAAPTVPRRPGATRRFFRALWDFVVTTLVMALFVGAWGLAANGVLEGQTDRVYAGAAATVLFTPMAIHRLTGRRGRYALALFGSIVATVAAVYYVGLGEDQDPAILLAAMFGLQVIASFLMTRLSRRRPAPDPYAGY
jgi:hypothetical protein